ncbi:MAG: Trm112 family protein [Candidatus Aenigmarchaeota archaeon]|nr:Trm112 family protein [Candidatus Aenigmarchaeota archaeon]
MTVPKELMEILACPKCKGDVKEKGMFILCEQCDLAYPVIDEDIPDMLIDDAWNLEKAKKTGFEHDLEL